MKHFTLLLQVIAYSIYDIILIYINHNVIESIIDVFLEERSAISFR